jgi:hypothetical protein
LSRPWCVQTRKKSQTARSTVTGIRIFTCMTTTTVTDTTMIMTIQMVMIMGTGINPETALEPIDLSPLT